MVRSEVLCDFLIHIHVIHHLNSHFTRPTSTSIRENIPGGVHLMMSSGRSTVPKILNTGSTIVSHKIKVSEERCVAVVSGTRY